MTFWVRDKMTRAAPEQPHQRYNPEDDGKRERVARARFGRAATVLALGLSP